MALGDYVKTTWVEGGPPGISAEKLNEKEDKIYELDQAQAAHEADYAKLNLRKLTGVRFNG